jgi:acyl-homoserine lactone acylase PvdQ
MTAFRTLDESGDLTGKRVLLRVDLNVPVEDGAVTDATRIERVAPTIRELSDRGARVLLLAHFGRPKGRRVPDMSLAPVAPAVADAVGRPVAFADDCVGPKAEEALAHLGEWDRDLAPDSAAAALYEVWCEHIARRVLLPLLGDRLYEHFHGRRQWTNAFQYQVLPNLLAFPTARWFGRNGAEARDDVLREALDGALEELTGSLGEDVAAWRWGALHKASFVGRLALIPDLAEMFTAGVVEMGGDEQTINQAMYEPGWSYDVSVAPSWRQILDLSDWDASLGVHPGGQSGNPASPHFHDQLELWGAGKHHPLPFSRNAVDKATRSTLRLHP